MNKCFAVTLTLLSLFFSAAATSEPDWYQVEVIIFSQQDLFEAEIPRRDIKLYYPDNHVWLSEPPEEDAEPQADIAQLAAVMHNQATLEDAPTITETPYIKLAKEQRALNPDDYTLERAPGYRVLFHQAWRQPAQSPRNTPWILIQGGKSYDDHFELEGSLRLYQSRYLHVQTNLWKVHYLPARSQPVNSDIIIPPEEKPWPEIPATPEPPPVEITTVEQLLIDVDKRSVFPVPADATAPSYQPDQIFTLKSSQRITAEQLHYMDHPNMGVLVLVTPFDGETQEQPTE